MGEHLGKLDAFVVEIACTQSQFCIRSISCTDRYIRFDGPQSTISDLQAARSNIVTSEATEQELEKRLVALNQNQQRQQDVQERQRLHSTRENTKANTSALRAELEKRLDIPVEKGTGDTSDTVHLVRDHLDEFLKLLAFPKVAYVDAGRLQVDLIPELISMLLAQKSGRHNDNEKHWTTVRKMNRLLQAEVEVSQGAEQPEMHINGAPYHQASSGTQITLSFFGLTNLSELNSIVLWDEPENGLHPTRRARLLELMFKDGRQFVVATHASEFAPVFAKSGKVFRCTAQYEPTSTVVQLRTEHVADRRDAFLTLDALGVHPARTLFTANVVIWVEGPTELLFYRHWLNPLLEAHQLVEGFHYTFMQYGGALISYLSIADDAHVESTFDLLSMCRHPVILVDSDFREDPGPSPSNALKRGALRLYQEVNGLNVGRPGSAMFDWTSGREVENYLPVNAIWHAIGILWKHFNTYAETLRSEHLSIGQYQSYEADLEAHFVKLGVVDENKSDATKPLAKGRSVWGAGNKVEMMATALTASDLRIDQLQWNCNERLRRVVDFIVSISQR
ncbi:AAA family ATPase [Paraburkholderia caribensis]|uniref:AAA family ATPase n=1 Tax=Paraburkholderia caribensis TaxID=75105 RepID=UPI001314CA9C|nr:AAA family ATPase [Paraburkholderia caribensis]